MGHTIIVVVTIVFAVIAVIAGAAGAREHAGIGPAAVGEPPPATGTRRYRAVRLLTVAGIAAAICAMGCIAWAFGR